MKLIKYWVFMNRYRFIELPLFIIILFGLKILTFDFGNLIHVKIVFP
jgi:hypothetical protein